MKISFWKCFQLIKYLAEISVVLCRQMESDKKKTSIFKTASNYFVLLEGSDRRRTGELNGHISEIELPFNYEPFASTPWPTIIFIIFMSLTTKCHSLSTIFIHSFMYNTFFLLFCFHSSIENRTFLYILLFLDTFNNSFFYNFLLFPNKQKL